MKKIFNLSNKFAQVLLDESVPPTEPGEQLEETKETEETEELTPETKQELLTHYEKQLLLKALKNYITDMAPVMNTANAKELSEELGNIVNKLNLLD